MPTASFVARALVSSLLAALPPHTHAPFVTRALSAPGAHWTHAEGATTHVHVLDGSGAAAATTLVPRVERARRAVLAWLGATARDAGVPAVLEVLFVGSRDAMRPFTGGTPGGWSEPQDGAALFVAPATAPAPPLVHELTHVLSWRAWGTPGGRWLSEGVATAAVGGCHGASLHALAAGLARDGRSVPLATMRRAFVVEGAEGLRYYLEAGSLVTYVRERYGRDGLRRLWATGLRGVEGALGVTQDALEAAWRARVARETPAPADLYAAIGRDGCETR